MNESPLHFVTLHLFFKFWRWGMLGATALLGASLGVATVEFKSGEPAYVVARPVTALERRVTDRLNDYISKVIGAPVSVVADLANVPAGAPAIILSTNGLGLSSDLVVPADSPEGFALETRHLDGHEVIIAAGQTDRGLKRAVQRLVIGSEQRAPGLVLPKVRVAERPWIPRREWTLCAWSPELVRGVFNNPNADKRMNVWLYSDRQVAAYVEMFDWFGFSGSQLMDTVANYAAVGSREAYHGRLRMFTRALRENGQEITLWVWAAQFNNFGWVDPSVTYAPAEGKTAFDDPAVRSSFERYYDGYAELAPEVDLLITHFYLSGRRENLAL